MTDTTSKPLLSFPPATFAALSPSAYLRAHLGPDSSKTPSIRPNQRAPLSFRSPNINVGSLTHANGSAVVRLGNTAVVCGIRGEILKADDIPQSYNDSIKRSEEAIDKPSNDTTIEDLGLLVPNIELSTGCSPQYIPGNPPSAIAQSLTHRLRSLLYTSRLIPSSDLRIWSRHSASTTSTELMGEDEEDEDATPKVKGYWTLFIDVLFITLDGGAFDAAWGATMAALRNTRLPEAWWEADRELVLCSDKMSGAKTLSLQGLPVSVGIRVFAPGKGGKRKEISGKRRIVKGFGEPEVTHEQVEEGLEVWALADADTFEEDLCEEQISVIIDCSGGGAKILKIEKSGGTVVGVAEMKHVILLAKKRWAEWKKDLDAIKR